MLDETCFMQGIHINMVPHASLPLTIKASICVCVHMCGFSHLGNYGGGVFIKVVNTLHFSLSTFQRLCARDKHNMPIIPSIYAMFVCSACLLLFLPNCHRLCSNYAHL